MCLHGGVVDQVFGQEDLDLEAARAEHWKGGDEDSNSLGWFTMVNGGQLLIKECDPRVVG